MESKKMRLGTHKIIETGTIDGQIVNYQGGKYTAMDSVLFDNYRLFIKIDTGTNNGVIWIDSRETLEDRFK